MDCSILAQKPSAKPRGPRYPVPREWRCIGWGWCGVERGSAIGAVARELSATRSELAGDGPIPTGIRDNVYNNPRTGLSGSGNEIRGGATYYCSGGPGFCGRISNIFGTLANHSDGGYKMNYRMLAVGSEKGANLVILERAIISTTPNARAEYLHTTPRGVYKHANIINVAPGVMTIFSRAKFGYIVRHEVGHWMGLGHQLSSSLMSYEGKPTNFSGTDLRRLIAAY